MAEKLELELKLKQDLSDLSKKVDSTPGLSSADVVKAKKGLETATKAFDSKDWNTFQSAFENVVKILSKTLSASGSVAQDLKTLLDTQKRINDEINKAKLAQDAIKSRYTKDNRLSADAGKLYFKKWTEESKVSIRSNNNQVLGQEEVAEKVRAALEEFRAAGKKIASITNAEAQKFGFGGRTDFFNANKYIKAEQSYAQNGLTEINQYQEQIEKLGTEYNKNEVEIKRLEEASDTGSDEITKLYQAIVELGNSANSTATELKGKERRGTGSNTPSASGGIDLNEGASINTNNKTVASSGFGKAFKQFTLYAVALRTVKKALKEAAKTVRELDRALTEQAMVTGLTRKQTYGLLQDYQSMASRLGATTKEVSSTMTQFLRQGRSINESLKLTEAAVSAAKVAGISAADSINYLTTAINGFRLSADDAMKVSDKFAAVAATAATSYEEIAIALSKVAAQANLAGMSIDYTTALLTKGIETTREAPETIGTALKTVIARMRELGDYGETLEGDMDLNNVETQLAYIGIQLRSQNGELRSTEDVLNDLGGKWDTLNANQQAAIAKALAGTRQQSRLIAMMSDYERVIELQEVAQRSQGATMAQMATYMEGMDAALNKINVAWENIVRTISNSDVIIGLIDTVSVLLEGINGILSNTFGMVTALTMISLIGVTILGNKMREFTLARQQKQLLIEERQLTRKNNIERQEGYIKSLKDLAKQKEKLATLYKQNAATAKANGDLAAAAQWEQMAATAEAEQAEILEVTLPHEEQKLNYLKQENAVLTEQENVVGNLMSGFIGLATPIFMLISLWKTLGQAIDLVRKKRAVQHAEEVKDTAVETGMNATNSAAKIISQLGVYGIPIAIAVAAALGAAIIGISAAVAKNANTADNAAKDVNKLSKEIYDLNKKATELDSVIDKFDDIDNKVLKTNADLKEMNELLQSAADSLSDEEKEQFNTLDTAKARRDFLVSVQEDAEDELAKKRAKQADRILKLQKKGGDEWNKFLTGSSTEIIQARDAMYALNNATLYNYIDLLKEGNQLTKETAASTEQLVQAILEEVDAAKAASFLHDPDAITQYVNAIKGLSMTIQDVNGDTKSVNAASILTSDDYTVRQRTEAFEQLRTTIASFGDQDMLDAFTTAFSEWETFWQSMSDASLDYIDSVGASIDSINDLAAAIQDLGYDSKTSLELLDDLFSELQDGKNLGYTLADVLGLSMNSDEYTNVLNAFDKAFGTTILNMGQNIDKFKNTVDALYQKASEWSGMSETDKTAFISENAALFKGTSGEMLLKAFESGNYAAIHDALMQDSALLDQQKRLLEDVDRQLKIEYARAEKDRDYAYIRELEAYRKQLEDTNKIFLASLKQRYDQQQAQLDSYKDYLQKETDALVDSLEKRKEAYQKYFDAINQEAEAEEYEERANQLIENITRLGSSMNTDATAKRADLAKELEDLEKERLQTLRQQAQEAMIKSIEDQVTQINDNLEKLLTNEQALLNAMLTDAQSPSEMMASMMAAQFASGNNTELGMQSYLQQLQSTFAAIMPGVDWSNIDVERQGDSLILNIMGQQIQLNDNDQQTIYEAIQNALKQLGYN